MKRLEYLRPVVVFISIGLLITTLSRLFLLILFGARVTETQDYVYLFPIGLRMDIILLSYLSVPPLLMISLLPDKVLVKMQGLFAGYFILFLSFILLLEMATPNFINEYDTRPNKLFLDYLIYPKEVMGTLFKSYLPSILLIVAILSFFIYTLIRYRGVLFNIRPVGYKAKLIVFPFALFLIFFGARSSLTSKRPINASNAVFSTDQLTNSIALNSFYTVAFAAYSMKNEKKCRKDIWKDGLCRSNKAC